MDDVARGLTELQERFTNFDPATLEHNDEFLSATLRATQAAMRTHESEKIAALRNAVLNSAVYPIAEDEHAMFIDYIDHMTTWHVRILRFMQDPMTIAKHDQYWVAPNTSDALANIVWKLYPELRERSELFRQVINDLRRYGLITVRKEDLNERRGGQVHGIHLSWTTALGDRLLSFIAAPGPHPPTTTIYKVRSGPEV